MKFRLLLVSAITAGFTLCLAATPAAQGQTAGDQTTPESTSTSKQMQKAQRKADRKAHRAQTNAELRELEKHGYNPAGDESDYPQNLQNAQQKVDAEKQGAKAPRKP